MDKLYSMMTNGAEIASLYDEFQMPSPNAEIPLYDGPLVLTLNGHVSEFRGTIQYCWLPRPRVRVTMERPAVQNDFKMIFARDAEVKNLIQIPGLTDEIDFLPCESQIGTNCPIRIVGNLDKRLVIGSGDRLTRVESWIVNLDEYWMPKHPDEWRWHADEWTVTIVPVDDLGKRIKALKSSGGYIFTHRLTLSRTDGGSFDGTSAEHILHALYRFLSFVQGRTVNAVLPVGFDGDGPPVWRLWGAWLVGRWQGVNSWADPHDTGEFGDAFAGFMKLWRNPSWRNALDAAIHWYIDSNRNASVLEVGTVLNQMGLERLAWEDFVVQNKTMSAERFEELSAGDIIRRLLKAHGIPHALPVELPDLEPWAREFKWRDIADAIAMIRNTIIHPGQKHRERLEGVDDSPLLDVWRCGLWALELVLLRLFGYTGGYQDRRKTGRWEGQTDPVPWAQTAAVVASK